MVRHVNVRAPGEPDRGRAALLGCGFLGAAVAGRLGSAGWEVRALSRSFSPGAAQVLGHERAIVGDVADRALLQQVLAGAQLVVYCVGGLTPGGAELDPQRDMQNVLAPLDVVLHALAGRSAVRFVHLSSGGAIYGDAERLPVPESATPRPIGAYGRSRLEAERRIATARAQTPTLVLRCANAYGPGQPSGRDQGAIARFLHRVGAGLPIELYGTGDEVRDYVHAGDIADALVKLVDGGHTGTFNVGSGRGTTLRELVNLVTDALDRPAAVVEYPRRGFDVREIVLDIGRLRNAIAYEPRRLGPALRALVAEERPAVV